VNLLTASEAESKMVSMELPARSLTSCGVEVMKAVKAVLARVGVFLMRNRSWADRMTNTLVSLWLETTPPLR
jgi:hypothetical protein